MAARTRLPFSEAKPVAAARFGLFASLPPAPAAPAVV
jgi:hypothetical protein